MPTMSAHLEPPSLALVLHGRIGSWLVSATELPGAQRNLSTYRQPREAKAAAKYEQTSRLAALRAFAGFTHSSLWRHVVLANRRKGANVRVVIHSWSPEAGDVLDTLYKPAASQHDPPPSTDKVTSQHLSLARALALLDGLGGASDDLIMVARLDLLLYRDVPLAELARARAAPAAAPAAPAATTRAVGPSDVLYLPHTCVPSRMRLPAGMWGLESQVLRRTCSGGSGTERGAPTGRRMLPAQLTRYGGAIRSLDARSDFTLFVLDYFFIATPPVVRSFASLVGSPRAAASGQPIEAHGLDELADRLRRRFRGKLFPQWAHLYWAEHVTNTLVPTGMPLRFLLLHEADFSLARFWRFGRDCVTRVSRRAGQLGVADGLRRGGGEGAADDGEGDEPWAAFQNATEFARAVRGPGRHHLSTSPLAEQCPKELESGSHVFCPWFSRACAHEAAGTLAAGEEAGRFQASANLPPRQLMSAERCTTPACIGYEGTARKRRKSDAAARSV